MTERSPGDPQAETPAGANSVATGDPHAIVASLAAALTARSLYPSAHPRVTDSVKAAVTACDAFLAARGRDEIPVFRVGDDLAVAGEPLLGGGIVARGFHTALRRHAIEGLTVHRGLEAPELGGFLGDLCEGRGARSTRHLQVGQVTATVGAEETAESAPPLTLAVGLGEGESALAGKPAGGPGLAPGTLGDAAAALAALGRGQGGAEAFAALDRLAAQALDALALATEPLLPVAPAPGEEDELFQHSLRVCCLSLALGRALGFRGDPLRELGVAAFLHDVGKLALPAELRANRGRLDDASWRLMQLHPELGAARLCGAEGVPAVAVLVAYEHHLRPDGAAGGYPESVAARRPGLASQIVAVADSYDAFARAVAGQGVAGQRAALAMLETRAAAGALRVELVARCLEMLPVTAA